MIDYNDEHQVYMGPNDGPFRCDNCEHFEEGNKCNEEHIIELAREKKFGLSLLPDGLAKVDPGGCSDFFERKGADVPLSKYFGGGGNKVMKNMKKQYGAKKGKKVFYATANKLDVSPTGRNKWKL